MMDLLQPEMYVDRRFLHSGRDYGRARLVGK
jgi:hypothetical protein